ncbi:MAG: cbb3-type cytochrome c oxidase subunit 3 [Gemmatimonadaceae bacterium]
MSLTDIMSGANLSGFAEIGLIFFLIAFVIIVVRTFSRGQDAEMKRAARLPLDDDTTPLTPHNAGSSHGR